MSVEPERNKCAGTAFLQCKQLDRLKSYGRGSIERAIRLTA